jgi:hypothetical protein
VKRLDQDVLGERRVQPLEVLQDPRDLFVLVGDEGRQ